MPPVSPAISVIVPVFNTETYLSGCLQSIRNQSFKDFELILVDDGSTDKSGELCDSAAVHDSRIVVIHQSNRGLSAARNAGIDAARGEFITFIDSDDMVTPDFLSRLVGIATSHNADIVAAQCIACPDSAMEKPVTEEDAAARILQGYQAAMDSLYQRNIDNSACGKLFRATIWEGIRFREGILYEDLDIMYRVFLRASKVVATRLKSYRYRQNPSSITHTFSPRRLDVLDVTDRICRYAYTERPELIPAANSRKLSASFNMLMLITRHHASLPEAERRCYANIVALRRECLFDRNVRLKNKAGILLSYAGGKPLLKLLSRIF